MIEEGQTIALLYHATGLGKTYLAAFFAKSYNKVLFIAHREEILKQAKNTFTHLYPERATGIYNGFEKEQHADLLFASVYTLASTHHLQQFDIDEFDLIVVDEFHHAVAPTYERILSYFNPSFLLGITATPDRLDNKNVYSLCDGNVAISIHFLEAIRKQWLAPFIYYGIYDDIDYSELRWHNNSYDEQQLLQVQLNIEYAENVFSSWLAKKQTRTIGFCSSVKQARFLSNYFNEQGYQTIALHGGSPREIRQNARYDLINQQLDVIFTIDLFNEGVDIPSVDTLLFVRPTESLTIFTQQIGRGLRLSENKSHCVIIDLIGNYRNADHKMTVFVEDNQSVDAVSSIAEQLPEHCEFHLDLEVIQLLDILKAKRSPRKEQLKNAYFNLKINLGRRPTYIELHLKTELDSKAIQQEFGSYLAFLFFLKELTNEERIVFKTFEHWFSEITKTAMTKSYKMVVLKALLEKGVDHWLQPTTAREIAPFFHHYLTEKDYRMRTDFSDQQGRELHSYQEKKVASLIHRMPLTVWGKSSKGVITYMERIFTIHLQPTSNQASLLFEWTREICDYRLHVYFERKSTLIQ